MTCFPGPRSGSGADPSGGARQRAMLPRVRGVRQGVCQNQGMARYVVIGIMAMGSRM